MPGPPQHVRVGDRTGAFARRDDLYGVRVRGAAADATAIARIPEDATTTVVIYRGHPPRDASHLVPIYAAGGDGPLAVPTGRVLVRFAESIRAEDRRTQLADAGFKIDRTLSYAPSAAWVAAATEDAGTAFERLDDLAALPDVVHVEPQFLLERAHRR